MEESAGEIGAPSKSETSAKAAGTKSEPEQPPQLGSDDVPDPDEDDLDDLDDMLDEFSSVKVTSKEPEVPPGPSKPSAATDVDEASADDILSDEDFAKQLQAGMADLLGEIENNPAVSAQFESIFKELSASADPPAAGAEPVAAGRGAGAAASTEESFQETIRKTMERMQTSGDQATAAAEAEGAGLLEELMKQMQADGGEGGEEEFSKMLLGMMEQLTNKEILYEPMKELSQKFPDWLETNKSKTPADDLERYEEQEKLAKEIVAKFEEPTYSDSNAADREYIVDRMQKMQAAGSPPSDLVGDMPSAQDALNAPDESCNPQ